MLFAGNPGQELFIDEDRDPPCYSRNHSLFFVIGAADFLTGIPETSLPSERPCSLLRIPARMNGYAVSQAKHVVMRKMPMGLTKKPWASGQYHQSRPVEPIQPVRVPSALQNLSNKGSA